MFNLSSYIYFFLFSVLLISLYSCNDSKTTEKETSVALMAANWTDTTTMGKVINDYYKDSVSKVGKISMEIRDPFMNSRRPNYYVQLQKVLRPQFKKASPTVGYMPVLMHGVTDSVIVDFQITWQQTDPKDSTGKFVVTDVCLQRVGKQPRYEWVQEGDYWIRKNVEVTEKNIQGKKLQKMTLEELKKIQENNAIKNAK